MQKIYFDFLYLDSLKLEIFENKDGKFWPETTGHGFSSVCIVLSSLSASFFFSSCSFVFVGFFSHYLFDSVLTLHLTPLHWKITIKMLILCQVSLKDIVLTFTTSYYEFSHFTNELWISMMQKWLFSQYMKLSLKHCELISTLPSMHYIWFILNVHVGINLPLGDCFSQHSPPLLLSVCIYFEGVTDAACWLCAAEDDCYQFKEKRKSQSVSPKQWKTVLPAHLQCWHIAVEIAFAVWAYILLIFL